ncbi:hypothetical protein, partial [Rhizobium glycinendophyticum]
MRSSFIGNTLTRCSRNRQQARLQPRKIIDERNKQKLQAELRDVAKRQDVIAAQITQRIMNGQSPIDAFNRMLDELQQRSSEIQSVLSTATKKRTGPAKTFTISPSLYANTIEALTYIARTGNTEHDAVQHHFNFLRSLVQKIIITPSSYGKAAELSIIGLLATILALMRAFEEYSAGIKERHRNAFVRRFRAGEFKAMVDQDVLARQLTGELDTEDKKQELLAAYAEELRSVSC